MAISKFSIYQSVMSYETDLSQPQTEITLFLQGSKTPLNLCLEKQIILGRAHNASPKKPDVDLTPYNAYEKGVSRLHLAIQWYDGQFTIVDLGSANGTWLNRRRLVPNKAEVVRDGDEIRLGQLVLFICLKKTTSIAECRPSAVLPNDRSRNSHGKSSNNQDTKQLSTEVLRRYWVPESSATMNLNFPDEDESAEHDSAKQDPDQGEVF